MDAAPLAKPVILFQRNDRAGQRTLGRAGRVHHVGEDGARLNGCELLVIAQKDHVTVCRERIEYFAKQGKGDH